MRIRDDEIERYTAKRGDLLICEGGEAGRAAVWHYDRDICFQNHIHRARFFGGIDSYLLYRYLQKLDATGELAQYRKGVGISNLSGKSLASIPVPLPPLPEQRRIVTKVDELMALCDTLQHQREMTDRVLPLLNRARHARFLQDQTRPNLDELFCFGASPTEIRRTVQALAFRGLITPMQTMTDGNAQSVSVPEPKPKSLRKRPPWHRSLREASALFEVPSHWIWARVADVVSRVTVGYVGSMASQYRPQGIPFLRSQNVRENRFSPKGLVYISPDFHEAISKSALEPGDVVVTRSGNVGVSCVIPENLREANCSDLVIIKQPSGVLPKFLCYYINSVATHQIAMRTVGIALTHFNTQSVAQISIPVPPIQEQHGIIDAVEALLNSTEDLARQQQELRITANAFAEAAIALITGALALDSMPLKMPTTQLVTRLRTQDQPENGSNALLFDLLCRQNGRASAKDLWQRSGLPIDAFYQQLKTEMSRG